MANVSGIKNEEDAPDSSGPAAGVERGDRSATRYPFYDLQEAENFALAVRDTGGSSVPEDDLLKHLGVSKTTKSWVYKLSTAREFGLVDRKGQKDAAQIALTDLAKRIQRPSSEAELAASRIAAFLTPPLYKKLFEVYRGETAPKVGFLANALARDPHKLVESVTEQAAKAFLQSATHAKLLVDGVFASDATGGKSAVNGKQNLTPPGAKDEEKPKGEGSSDQQSVKVPANFIPHPFQLRRDMTIVVPLPPDLNSRDVARLHKWMQTLPIEDEEGGLAT